MDQLYHLLQRLVRKKWYVLLICSQRKHRHFHRHFQEKCQEKSGKAFGRMCINLRSSLILIKSSLMQVLSIDSVSLDVQL